MTRDPRNQTLMQERERSELGLAILIGIFALIIAAAFWQISGRGLAVVSSSPSTDGVGWGQELPIPNTPTLPAPSPSRQW